MLLESRATSEDPPGIQEHRRAHSLARDDLLRHYRRIRLLVPPSQDYDHIHDCSEEPRLHVATRGLGRK
jgi:hypothetical protein